MTAGPKAVPGRPALVGTVQAPPSKSETHRAYVLAALSDGPCEVEGPLDAADPRSTMGGLAALGAVAFRSQGSVRFEPSPWRPPAGILDAGNSGTTLRLLAPQAARFAWATTFDGDASLRRRPSRDLQGALQALGATMERHHCPLTVRGPIRSGHVILADAASSQPVSGLLLALPALDGPSAVTVRGPLPSAGYVDLTIGMARRAGLRVETEPGSTGSTWRVPGGQRPNARRIRVQGDWSAAAWWAVGAAVTGGRVRVTGLDARSPQADRRILGLVQAFGARVRSHDDGATVDGPGREGLGAPVHPIDVSGAPDLFPALAVLAAASPGTTTFTGIAGLRAKESDRVAAMVEGLRRMGVEALDGGDHATIEGTAGALRHAPIDARGDHRIHMAFALAGLLAQGPAAAEAARSLADQGALAGISYPGFHAELARLQEGA